jgi:archaellum biogenesis protein FlaJ (TadC family)
MNAESKFAYFVTYFTVLGCGTIFMYKVFSLVSKSNSYLKICQISKNCIPSG